MHQQPQPIESQVRDACHRGDHARAATLFLETHGSEILSYLAARMRNESDAAEVFSQFGEDFWRGLPSFRWRCGIRAWAYTVARNAAQRFSLSPRNKAARHVPLSRAGELAEVIERIRSTTRPYLKTHVKAKMQQLRERLPQADQDLIILRVDRNLSWRDLAQAMHSDERSLDDKALDRESARLRKRFQAAKEKLRQLAIAEGLLPNDRH